MGRKIPGKKHRGVRDLEKQNQLRWAELQTKINAPPKNVDEQTIPKSLERVIKLKDLVKSGKIPAVKKRKRNKSKNKLITLGPQNIPQHPNNKPDKAVPVFDQQPGESTQVFWHRVGRETHQFVNETHFEKKFGVQIKRNPGTGEIEGVEKQPKDELDEYMKLKMKHQNINKKKKKKKDVEPKLTKVQKRKQKLDLKKSKKLEEVDVVPVREEIKFGEVCHAPPNLSVKPRGAEKLLKTGVKGLLLSSILNEKSSTKDSNKFDSTGKRKNLPAAERRILENMQSNAIEAYKLMKARKAINS